MTHWKRRDNQEYLRGPSASQVLTGPFCPSLRKKEGAGLLWLSSALCSWSVAPPAPLHMLSLSCFPFPRIQVTLMCRTSQRGCLPRGGVLQLFALGLTVGGIPLFSGFPNVCLWKLWGEDWGEYPVLPAFLCLRVFVFHNRFDSSFLPYKLPTSVYLGASSISWVLFLLT